MTAASKVTLTRIFLIPVYMVLMYVSGGVAGPWMWGALGVFILASVTDFVDGYIARHCNQVSDFGKFLDPLADKLLVIAAMAMFCEWGLWPAWALMAVLAREFAVTGLRLVAAGKGTVIAAGWSGKVKTASTMVGLVPPDGIPPHPTFALGRHLGGGGHNPVFRGGVLCAELEVPLELKRDDLGTTLMYALQWQKQAKCIGMNVHRILLKAGQQ